MTKPAQMAEARVRHYVESAERCHRHNLEASRDRFIGFALDILNEKRVRNAGAWRQRLLDLGDAA